jgi:hypothetical protein
VAVRSGRRRSEGRWRAGARFDFTLVSRACRGSLEHSLCHKKRFSGNRRRLVVRAVVSKLDAYWKQKKLRLTLNEEKVPAQSHYLNNRVRRDVGIVSRTSAPQFAMN